MNFPIGFVLFGQLEFTTNDAMLASRTPELIACGQQLVCRNAGSWLCKKWGLGAGAPPVVLWPFRLREFIEESVPPTQQTIPRQKVRGLVSS
jgi:hypothetical protein